MDAAQRQHQSKHPRARHGQRHGAIETQCVLAARWCLLCALATMRPNPCCYHAALLLLPCSPAAAMQPCCCHAALLLLPCSPAAAAVQKGRRTQYTLCPSHVPFLCPSHVPTLCPSHVPFLSPVPLFVGCFCIETTLTATGFVCPSLLSVVCVCCLTRCYLV